MGYSSIRDYPSIINKTVSPILRVVKMKCSNT